jgi:hypothetical protein
VGEKAANRGSLEVGANGFFDAGVPDLDSDARAVFEKRAMDLTNRSAGHGFRFDSRQQCPPACAEILGDGPLDEREGSRLRHHLQHRQEAPRLRRQ